MKVRAFPVESTNPFADAAGGAAVGDPSATGQAAATGGVATEWQRAVEAVSGQAQGQSSHAGDDGSSKDQSSDPSDPPMGAQWDRLSMTVASLVAWNLTANESPDSLAGRSSIYTNAGATSEALLATNLDAIAVEVASASSLAASTTALQTPLDSSASSAESPQIPTAAVSSLKTGQISARIAGQTGTLIQPTEDHAFREGKELAPQGVRNVLTSTDSVPEPAWTERVALAGTMEGAAAHTVSDGPAARLQPEIPTPMAAATASIGTTATAANDASSAAQAVGVSNSQQGRNGSSGVSASESGTASATVLAETGQTKVLMPEVVSERVHKPGARSRSVPNGSALSRDGAPLDPDAKTSTVQAEGKVGTKETDIGVKPAPSQSPIRSADKPAPPQSLAPFVGDQDVASEMLDELARPQGKALSKLSNDWTKRGPLTSRFEGATPTHGATGGGEAATTNSTLHQAVSEMERDFAVNESVMDSEQITADEVPELPINDPVQLDVDIDDPAGRVRLDMTKQAEEIAIRLETPSEILEEYKDMKDEIADSLDDAGMSLADFQAAAEGESDGTDKESREEPKDGSQTRDVGPEEAEGRGRILNRIV